jgi:hypothetical protein
MVSGAVSPDQWGSDRWFIAGCNRCIVAGERQRSGINNPGPDVGASATDSRALGPQKAKPGDIKDLISRARGEER